LLNVACHVCHEVMLCGICIWGVCDVDDGFVCSVSCDLWCVARL
jgi:hypothetical protein